MRQSLAFFAFVADADGFGEELVGAHADQWSDDVKRHVVASFRERVHPGLRMRVVAVYERAVYVEDYSLEQQLLQGLLNRFSLGEVPLDNWCCFLNQVLELRVLRLAGRLGGHVEDRLVSIDLGVNVRLVEILAFG